MRRGLYIDEVGPRGLYGVAILAELRIYDLPSTINVPFAVALREIELKLDLAPFVGSQLREVGSLPWGLLCFIFAAAHCFARPILGEMVWGRRQGNGAIVGHCAAAFECGAKRNGRDGADQARPAPAADRRARSHGLAAGISLQLACPGGGRYRPLQARDR
jgi:hypothetical protein